MACEGGAGNNLRGRLRFALKDVLERPQEGGTSPLDPVFVEKMKFPPQKLIWAGFGTQTFGFQTPPPPVRGNRTQTLTPPPRLSAHHVEEVRTTFGPNLLPNAPDNFPLAYGQRLKFCVHFVCVCVCVCVSSKYSEFYGEFKDVRKTLFFC